MHKGLGHSNYPRNGKQHKDAKNERQTDAHRSGLWPNVFRQLIGQDADEDDIVNAEDDFQKGQRQKGKEGLEGE